MKIQAPTFQIHRFILSFAIALLAGGVFVASASAHAGPHSEAEIANMEKMTATTKFRLRAGATKTVDLGYPSALKYGDAHYLGKAFVLIPKGTGTGKAKPRRSKVRFLYRGAAEGGSVFRVTVANKNSLKSAPVMIKVRATTAWKPVAKKKP